MAYAPFTQTRGVLEMQYELPTRGDPRMLVAEAAVWGERGVCHWAIGFTNPCL